MEMIQSFCMALIDCLCFTAVEKSSKYYGPAHFDFRISFAASSVPDIFVQSAEDGTSPCNFLA